MSISCMMLVVICIDLERWHAVPVDISWIQNSDSRLLSPDEGAIRFQSPAEADEAACIKKRRHKGSVVSRFTCETRKPTSEAKARECRGLRRHVAVRYPAKDL